MRAALASLALALAGAASPRYGDTLLAEVRPVAGCATVHIEAIGKGGGAITLGPVMVGGSSAVLTDAMGQPIGTVTVAAGPARAASVAGWLKRRIYIADNLTEPDPFVAGARRWNRAQALVEATLEGNSDLVTLALHVNLPGGGNTIVASSFGRIGKPADKDDLHVIRDGAVLSEITNDGRRLAVELPLTDRQGRTIGALSTSFLIPSGADPQQFRGRANAVRDTMARNIISLSALAAY